MQIFWSFLYELEHKFVIIFTDIDTVGGKRALKMNIVGRSEKCWLMWFPKFRDLCVHVFDAILFDIDNVQIEGLNVKFSYVCLRLPHTSAIQNHYALAHY